LSISLLDIDQFSKIVLLLLLFTDVCVSNATTLLLTIK